MKANLRGLTRVEMILIIVIPLVLAVLILPALARQREEARKTNCMANLKHLGKAMAAYREDSFGYFPFSWQRAGDPEPVGIAAAQAAMAATSLGNLYPRYVQNAKLFKCPSTENSPSFVLNLPLEYRNFSLSQMMGGKLPAGSNWTLADVAPGIAGSYGYDPRIARWAKPNGVVMADMNGTWGWGGLDNDMNHGEGQSVLYVDSHVKWQGTNFCSADPNDNIFAEDAWSADTDTYLLNKDAGLEISFDGYKRLHYPQKAKP